MAEAISHSLEIPGSMLRIARNGGRRYCAVPLVIGVALRGRHCERGLP
jgi:hypothetical protein